MKNYIQDVEIMDIVRFCQDNNFKFGKFVNKKEFLELTLTLNDKNDVSKSVKFNLTSFDVTTSEDIDEKLLLKVRNAWVKFMTSNNLCCYQRDLEAYNNEKVSGKSV